MKVHEIMTGHPQCVAPATSLVEAAGLMRQHDIGALPVCEGGQLAGIVTDRDMVVRGLADGRDPATATVSEVMSGGVEAVSADDEVENAVRIMEQRQIRRLPVLDRAKRLVGMVSLGDVATSSNPAFGGLVLRDVSESSHPNARRRRLQERSEPVRAPLAEGSRRGPGSAPRGGPQATAAAARTEPTRRKRGDGRSSKRKASSSTTHRRRGVAKRGRTSASAGTTRAKSRSRGKR